MATSPDDAARIDQLEARLAVLEPIAETILDRLDAIAAEVAE